MSRARVTGFTMVELLVAISLLGLLAIISWRGLDHVVAQRSRVDADAVDTDRVLRTLAQVQRDLEQRVPDALFAGRYGGEGALPLALRFSDDEGRERIRVLRTYPGTLGARAVEYAVENSQLVRHLQDASGTHDFDRVPMLDAVRGFEIRVLVDGRWMAPLSLEARASGARATALRLTIERRSGERYVQVLQI